MRRKIRLAGFGSFFGSMNSLEANAAVYRNRLVLVGFGAVLLFAWFCYQPALSGTFQLDDEFNLSGLAEIDDARSAFSYIFSGISGPTGRPLALTSFALQANHWEQGASPFLRVNILIHLINAALLALSFYQLSLRRGVKRDNAAIVAFATATLWVLMPLLATTSLLVVQRMTALSASFMLLGLNGYLLARANVNDKPKRALVGMSASLAVGTILATLCKETGVLLPVLVLVLEATVLERPTCVNGWHWRIWHSVFLVLPLALLLAYLASHTSYPDGLLGRRDFNAWERQLTEARILWVYLLKALIGIPNQLGIYQDAPAISRTLFSPVTFIACFAWLTLLFASIAWRRRYPLFAVGVLWYLAGHLVESTVVPLELYFEHRNYIPIIGPLFALSCFLFLGSTRHRQAAGVLIPVLALVNAWFLYSFASLSGDPSFAARYWAAEYPASQRAVSRMAKFQLHEERPQFSLMTIESFVKAHPEHAYMRIPALNLKCQLAPDREHHQQVLELERELPKVDYNRTVARMLFELFRTASASDCNGVDPQVVAALATKLRGNPRYKSEPLYNQAYQKILAAVARRQGDYDAVVDHLHQAIAYQPGVDLNNMMVAALVRSGKLGAARDFLDDAATRAPLHPVKAVMWQRDLDRLREYIRQFEQNAGQTPASEAAPGKENGQS